MRIIKVAAAQMGPIQRSDSRDAVIPRMLALMEEAKGRGADLIVYPELALTTFFPRWYMGDQAEVDTWFEREMPNATTMPLFKRAAEYQMAMSFGYAELTPDGHHFNTCILTDKSAKIVGKYRKVHLPGHSEFDTERAFQHLEKRYFEPGDTGFRGVAHDGRHLRHGDLQRPALAGDLSRDGPARRGDDPARLQHALGQFPEKRGGA